jgi:hypothetical protein
MCQDDARLVIIAHEGLLSELQVATALFVPLEAAVQLERSVQVVLHFQSRALRVIIVLIVADL